MVEQADEIDHPSHFVIRGYGGANNARPLATEDRRSVTPRRVAFFGFREPKAYADPKVIRQRPPTFREVRLSLVAKHAGCGIEQTAQST